MYPCQEANPLDYHIPPLERLDLNGVRTLIRQQKYFVLHAPRQTGKTSALLALRDLGLVRRVGPVAIANPIYREIIPRALTYTTQEMAIHHDLSGSMAWGGVGRIC